MKAEGEDRLLWDLDADGADLLHLDNQAKLLSNLAFGQLIQVGSSAGVILLPFHFQIIATKPLDNLLLLPLFNFHSRLVHYHMVAYQS